MGLWWMIQLTADVLISAQLCFPPLQKLKNVCCRRSRQKFIESWYSPKIDDCQSCVVAEVGWSPELKLKLEMEMEEGVGGTLRFKF
ncbi:hypothetical protein ACS0TY_008370 [Phlomoides rotata]